MSMAFVAGGTAVVGAIAGWDSNNRSIKAQESANARATALQSEQLEFQMQQYEDWKSIYGEVQEDLSTFYRNLNARDILPNELNTIRDIGQKRQEATDKALAQRGLDTSGVSAQNVMQIEHDVHAMQTEATNTADQRVAEQQMQFAGMGLGQGQSLLGNMSNSSNRLANTIQQGASAVNQARGQQTALYEQLAGLGTGILAGNFKAKPSTPDSGQIEGWYS